MLEKKIFLDEIDHSKEKIHEIIGISRLELLENFQKICEEDTPKTLSSKLGFSVDEIIDALNSTQRISEAIVRLWKNKGRTEISLKEFIQTAVLIKNMRKSPEMLLSLAEKALLEELVEIVESHGSQVLMNTSPCEEWRKNHPSCKGCPSELGCRKMNLITHCLKMKMSYEPKSFEDFLSTEKWTREKIEEILKAKDLNQLNKIFIP
jgi:hypothetical protein